ncbi:MAG: iron ABC transporter [Candidatus Altiarchaeales archaeon WOR_SM1_86-2]|nr:MAG: iron ABC transporter [Candidatus Altiarchaeales archaeon WOR_SM1_86-2]
MPYIQKRKRYGITVISLIFLLFISVIFSITQGSAGYSVSKVFDILMGNGAPNENKIIFDIRLPRIILAVLVGASLSISGVVLQALFRNPMADPYILGISSGAGLGASIAILFGISFTFIGFSGISAYAFFGGLAAILLVYNIAKIRGSTPTTTLLLSGIAVGAFFSACVGFLKYISGEDLHKIVLWFFGHISESWGDVMTITPYFLVGSITIYIFSRDLNVMLLGEEDAKHLGIDTELVKKIMLGCAAIITAAAVSVSGLIGFIGLVIPHITRILVGPDHRILIPASMLLGSVVLVLTDTFSRIIISPADVPVGIITALFGAPFFVYLLKKRKHEYF